MPPDQTPPSSSPEDEDRILDSETEEESHEDEQESSPDEKPSAREEMIRRLTGESTDEDEESDDTDDDPESSDEEEQPHGEGKSNESASEDEHSREESSEDEEDPDPLHIPEEEWRRIKRKTRKRIDQFRNRIKDQQEKLEQFEKEREPLANYGQSVLGYLNEHKIQPEAFGGFLNVAAIINRGGQEAIDAALTIAKNLGWKGTEESAPKDEIHPVLRERVRNLDLDEETAKEISRELYKQSPPPKQSDASPKNPLEGLTPKQETQQQAPQQQHDPEVIQATNELARLEAEAKAKYPVDWPKLEKALVTEMAKYKGSPPNLWPTIFRDSLEKVLAKRSKAVSSGPSSLGPGRKRSEKSFEELKGRERIVKGLTSGKIV